MKKFNIFPSTSNSYAYINLGDLDKDRIKVMKERITNIDSRSDELKGFRIEVSEHDQIPNDSRHGLIAGKFFVIK